MMIEVGLLRTRGAVVGLERLHIMYTRQEQASSALVLHSSGHPLVYVSQWGLRIRAAPFRLVGLTLGRTRST